MLVNVAEGLGAKGTICYQEEALGTAHAILCAERAVGNDPFVVLLADDFLTDHFPGVTADLTRAFENSGLSQLSVMRVDGPEISRYGVIVPSKDSIKVAGLIEKPTFESAPSDLASIGRYVLTSDIFEVLKDLPTGAGGEVQLADAINLHAKNGLVEAVEIKGRRFDCGSVSGFMAAVDHEYRKRKSKA